MRDRIPCIPCAGIVPLAKILTEKREKWDLEEQQKRARHNIETDVFITFQSKVGSFLLGDEPHMANLLSPRPGSSETELQREKAQSMTGLSCLMNHPKASFVASEVSRLMSQLWPGGPRLQLPQFCAQTSLKSDFLPPPLTALSE